MVEEAPAHQRRIFIAGAIAVLIICGVALYFLINRGTIQQTTSTNSSTPPSSSTHLATETPSSMVNNTWNTYRNVAFTIQYPLNWATKESKLGVIQRFVISPTGKKYPNFGGQVAPLTTVSIESLMNLYQKISFYSSTCTIGQQSCTFFLTYGKGQPTDGTVQEIAVITAYNGQSYFLRYEYVSTTRQEADEAMMNEFLKTFSFR